MASAGRILIMPKGDYDANSTYENLDLVKYKGTSWLAKKESKGIEPSEANTEYWHKMFDLNITNNLTTEEAGYALDARQGKVLKDSLVWNNLTLDTNVKLHANLGKQYLYISKTKYEIKISFTFTPVADIPLETEIISFTGISFKDNNVPVPIISTKQGEKNSYGLATYSAITTYNTLISGNSYVIDCIIPVL